MPGLWRVARRGSTRIPTSRNPGTAQRLVRNIRQCLTCRHVIVVPPSHVSDISGRADVRFTPKTSGRISFPSVAYQTTTDGRYANYLAACPPSSFQRHICFRRAPMGTVFRGAAVGEPLSRVWVGHAHCSKWSVMASGMNRERKAYMCRSPLLRC